MSEHRAAFVIHIDGSQFKVEKATLSGSEIKALAAKDSSYQLFLEKTGKEADAMVNDTDAIAMKNGLHFYTVPPATLGA
jgi:hypothetical protein